MIFNKLAKTVEKFYPELIPFVNKSKLFWINESPHEFLPEIIKEIDLIKETFFLPFQITAIEDKASIIILIDANKNVKGLSAPRTFIEFLPCDAPKSVFDPESEYSKKYINSYNPNEWKNKYLISTGIIRTVNYVTKKTIRLEGKCNFIDLVSDLTKTKRLLNQTNKKNIEAENSTLQNVIVAIQEVMYLNTPKQFIVETTSQKQKKKSKKKIRRSHERPLYTLMAPEQIRKKYLEKETQGERKSPHVHERRRHYRKYPDNPKRWPKVHGKTMVIPGCWIGKTRFEQNGKIYKVRIDL